MKILPVLLISGCLAERSNLSSEEETRCEPELSTLRESCQTRNGTFGRAVDDFKACFGDEVRVTCSWGDSFEQDILTIHRP